MSDLKHHGPHCAGLCEGAAYTIMLEKKDRQIFDLTCELDLAKHNTEIDLKDKRIQELVAAIQAYYDLDDDDKDGAGILDFAKYDAVHDELRRVISDE